MRSREIRLYFTFEQGHARNTYPTAFLLRAASPRRVRAATASDVDDTLL